MVLVSTVRKAAQAYWDSLTIEMKWQLGDDLVLDAFDWRDWFEEKPNREFMKILDEIRIEWESMR